MNKVNEKYGVWISNNIKFDTSYEAFLYASNNASTVNFSYHHDVYNNFDVSNLGKVDLNVLYQIRALRLREKYDYLILYYSGGSDSHNVLRTFIDNNIKLDEVCIKWPKPLLDGKFYTANTEDTTAKNYWSEWDYAVKPTLEWLASNRPDIKITFKDFIGDPDSMDIDKMFEDTAHHGFLSGILLNSLVSDSEPELISAGKTVANIYGIDKPKLATYDNKIFMFFSDDPLRTCVRSKINPTGAECFYWDPEMPEIAFEQAYQTAIHYKINKEDRKFLIIPEKHRTAGSNTIPSTEAMRVQQELCKKYIYTTWDYRFQSGKPASESRRDKFFWFHESDELARQKDIFHDNVNQRLRLVDTRFLSGEVSNPNNVIATLKPLGTPAYYITTLDDFK
jgi:hypothetical protein